jgi:hypothetical protein
VNGERQEKIHEQIIKTETVVENYPHNNVHLNTCHKIVAEYSDVFLS